MDRDFPQRLIFYSFIQEIPRILRNPKIRHSMYMSPPIVPVLSHINQVHPLLPIFKIHFTIILLSMSMFSECSLFFRFFSTKNLCVFLLLHTCHIAPSLSSYSFRLPQYRNRSKINEILQSHLPPYLLTPWCRVLLEKLTGLQLVKKFPAFHGTRRFITALTSVRHLSLFWARPIQSMYPHPTSWRSILILSTHLRLGLPCSLFPSGYLLTYLLRGAESFLRS